MIPILRTPLVCSLVAAAGMAQSAVRSWGSICFDTEGRHGEFIGVDAGYQTAVVLRNDGRAFAQGQNQFINANPSLPGCVDIPSPPSGLRYTRVCVSDHASLALLSDGTVQGWGYMSLAPVGVLPPAPLAAPPGTRYLDLDVGQDHGVMLRSDGVAVAFGTNTRGQTNVPTFPPGTRPIKVRAGATFSFAILSDGSLVGWGDNSGGLLNVPPLPPGVQYADVSADSSASHVVALRSDGSVVAWGNNTYGQCNVPALPAQTTYLLAGAGTYHSTAWRSDGVFVCWGESSYGALNAPVVPAGTTCKQLACGSFCTLAVMSNGRVITWGFNNLSYSQLPELPRTAGDRPLSTFRAIGANQRHSMAVLSDGTIRGWGWDYGVPGLLVPPPGTDGKFVKIACGYGSNVGLLTDGRVVAWGTVTTGASVPALPPSVRYVDVAMGTGHAVAIRSDGQAVAFGPNLFGEGNIAQPPPGLRYTQAACEYGKTMLVRSDGQVIAVGSHDTTAANVPPLPTGVRYVQVSAPEFFTGALRSDGTIAIWGSQSNWTPFPPLPFGVSYVEISGRYTLIGARRSDGQIVVAGTGAYRAAYPPPLDLGTSYVEVAVGGINVLGRVGPTSTYVTFASGCAGSLPPARLVPMDTPRIGHTLEINLFDLPADAAFVVLGWNRIAPMSLAPFGLPGCDQQITIDDVALVTGQNGTATHRVPIPNLPVLIGTHFFHQALVPDPRAGNAFGAVVSNAAEGVVGDC